MASALRQQLARRLLGEPAGSSANFARVDVVVAQRQEKMAALVADVSVGTFLVPRRLG
jgi:hypothetical protein